MAAFQQDCGPLTLAFATISGKVRQVQLKLKTKQSEEAIFESTQSLGMGLNEPALAKMVQDIQMLEKTHLEKRVVINDKIVKLAMLDYELKKQKFIKKTIEDSEIEVTRMPYAIEIDNLRREEGDVLQSINDAQMELRIAITQDDY